MDTIEDLIKQGEAILAGEREAARRRVQEDALFEEQLKERFVACVEELFPEFKGFVSWECWEKSRPEKGWDSQALVVIPGLARLRIFLRSHIENRDVVKTWDIWCRNLLRNGDYIQVLQYGMGMVNGKCFPQEAGPEMLCSSSAVALARAKEVGDTYGQVLREIEKISPPAPLDKGGEAPADHEEVFETNWEWGEDTVKDGDWPVCVVCGELIPDGRMKDALTCSTKCSTVERIEKKLDELVSWKRSHEI